MESASVWELELELESGLELVWAWAWVSASECRCPEALGRGSAALPALAAPAEWSAVAWELVWGSGSGLASALEWALESEWGSAPVCSPRRSGTG